MGKGLFIILSSKQILTFWYCIWKGFFFLRKGESQTGCNNWAKWDQLRSIIWSVWPGFRIIVSCNKVKYRSGYKYISVWYIHEWKTSWMKGTFYFLRNVIRPSILFLTSSSCDFLLYLIPTYARHTQAGYTHDDCILIYDDWELH